ncbi:MAG: glycosyltransferase N-terminal domain-containing protein [Leptospira sp.]|nr:glycosyltransferase N-terminal domain-containing protein [Leptospira sp.]
MYFFYNLLLFILFPLFYFLYLIIPKLKRIVTKRKLDKKRILALHFEKGKKKVIWLHSASVGELDQARALAKVIKEKSTDNFIIQSYYSDSVTEKHLSDQNFDLTFILPFDFPFAYSEILKKYKPDICVILAWDTWPNLIRNWKKFGAKVYLACATLSANSGRIKGFAKKFTSKIFSYFDGIYVSHEILLPLFQDLVGKSKVLSALGDTRFDTVLNRINSGTPPISFSTFESRYSTDLKSAKIMLLGSTYPICESYFLQFLESKESETYLETQFWIFPHKWDTLRAESLITKLSKFGSVKTYSQILTDKNQTFPRFILFDEMGILAFAYKYALFAYIGGGFHHRIHNTIEPAAFGLPILCGPKIFSSPEAIVMHKLGGVFIAQNNEEYNNHLIELLSSMDKTRQIGEKNRKFVLDNMGASLRIYLKVFSDALN